jgi:AcrR family transcriptional regulator
MAAEMPQMLRSDARENRDRVLEAARELFSERGLDVPIRAIARRAEVGPATLYRRFPTKQALVDAAFADELRACATIVRDGCADPDPWRGLCSVVRGIAELNARNQGFVDAFVSSHPAAIDFGEHRASMLRSLSGLCGRAKDAGALRADIVLDDLVLVFMVGRGLPAAPPAVRLTAARRLAALAIEAFRAGGTEGHLPPPARLSPTVA